MEAKEWGCLVRLHPGGFSTAAEPEPEQLNVAADHSVPTKMMCGRFPTLKQAFEDRLVPRLDAETDKPGSIKPTEGFLPSLAKRDMALTWDLVEFCISITATNETSQPDK